MLTQDRVGAYGEAEFVFACVDALFKIAPPVDLPCRESHSFSSIKVITIVGLIILGIILDLGGGPDHDRQGTFTPGVAFGTLTLYLRIGFRYWKHPGPFVQYHGIPGATGRFVGWWSVASLAAFSFIGTEIVAVSAARPALSLYGAQVRRFFRSLPERLRTLVVVCQRPSVEFTSVSFCKYRISFLLSSD